VNLFAAKYWDLAVNNWREAVSSRENAVWQQITMDVSINGLFLRGGVYL
jgi:hypothetical protein